MGRRGPDRSSFPKHRQAEEKVLETLGSLVRIDTIEIIGSGGPDRIILPNPRTGRNRYVKRPSNFDRAIQYHVLPKHKRGVNEVAREAGMAPSTALKWLTHLSGKDVMRRGKTILTQHMMLKHTEVKHLSDGEWIINLE